MSTSTYLTVESTKNWAWNNEYNLQLSPGTHEKYFSDIPHGGFLKLEREHSGVTFAIFAKVDIKDINHLGPGEVGIGLNLRYSLGVSTGESICVSSVSPPRRWTERIDKSFGKRPVLCRVRKGVHPDIGFDICRISRTSMDALGVTSGDRVVVESAETSKKLKVLPLREKFTERKKKQTKQNPGRYPDPVEVLNLESIAGTKVDIPEIYIDSEQRKELDLSEQTDVDDRPPLSSGVGQPVKVTRDATSVYVRSLNDVTVPAVTGLFATILVFDPWLTKTSEAAIVGLGVFIILLSIWYRVRKQTFA